MAAFPVNGYETLFPLENIINILLPLRRLSITKINYFLFVHGVFIWQTVSFLFQPDVSLKNPCPASLGVRERVPCPQSRPASAREARLPWRGDPSGHPASMAVRAPGHADLLPPRRAMDLSKVTVNRGNMPRNPRNPTENLEKSHVPF